MLGAGEPAQKIFQREVTAFHALLNERFGTRGQVLRLGATSEAEIDWPLLNRTNLEAGLSALSRKMDVDEDIALLFLTSHGQTDQISTSFPGLNHNDLTATEVRSALEASGIGQSIIIVSACYSGSFIDDLEAPDRLVMTASAADRNSFGCNDSNELTDWGSAFFGNALTQTLDFIEAAKITADLVATSEAETGHTPSLPQISIGENIAGSIRSLAKQFTDDN